MRDYHEIVSVEVVDGKLEVVRKYPSNQMLLCDPPRPASDTVVKEIYGIVDGKIEIIKEIAGSHTPAETITTNESITFG